MIETFPSGTRSQIGPSGIHRQGSRVRGSGSTAFAPTDVAGLEMWLKADSLALSDGTAVGTWTDSSAGGHNATQATGSLQPLYKTGIVNGKPVLRFDGVDDFMSATLVADASRTIFIVAKKATSGGSLRLMLFGFLIYTPGGTWLYNRNQAVTDVTLTGATDTNWNVLTFRVNSAASLDAYVNGGTAISFDPEDTVVSATSLVLGSDVGASANVDIAEVLSYSNALSDTDRGSVTTYLGSKYGLF